MAGNAGGDERCGCRSSGEVELVASRHGEGVAAMPSAMAWESEGEELERRGGV